jgi:hypothetical protein
MNATIEIRRRDPAVIARAHAVLDASARMHARWPNPGRKSIGEAFTVLHVALEEYGAAADEGGDIALAAETASWAMALLLLAIGSFLGKAAADEMARNAAEVAR